MHAQPQLRQAEKSDCRIIARLYSIASDGVADYVWTQLAEPGEDPQDVGTRRYEREATDFSYQNCTIIEANGVVAGMLAAFPMEVDEEFVEEDPVLKPYSKLEEDNSYYICGIALFPEFRGQGMGTLLMKHAEQEATRLGYTPVSLVVFTQNRRARELYERLGYREVAREPVVPHPLIHVTGDAVLMVKHL